jgi:hypothetical protein
MNNRVNRVLLIFAFLYVISLLLWFSIQPMPELQDLAEWVFQSAVMERLLNPASLLHAQFAWVHMAVPNMLAQLLLMGASSVVGPFAAVKLLLVAYCVAALWICGRAARRFRPANPAPLFVLLLCIAAFNSCFWHGYINYQISLLIFLLYLELTAKKHPSIWMIFFFSLLLFCCHASMFAAFVLLVFIKEWRRSDRWAIGTVLLPGIGLMVFYLRARSRHLKAGAPTHFGNVLSHMAYKAYTILKLGPFHNLVIANGESAKRLPLLYWAGVGVNLMFGACLVLALSLALLQLSRRGSLRKGTGVMWGVLAILFLVMPADLAEVVNLGERFLILLVILMLIAAPDLRLWSMLAGLGVAGFVLTAVQLPGASLQGMGAAEAYRQPVEAGGRAYSAKDGLFSHRLYQNDERRIELRDHPAVLEPLLFDTGLLRNQVHSTCPLCRTH